MMMMMMMDDDNNDNNEGHQPDEPTAFSGGLEQQLKCCVLIS